MLLPFVQRLPVDHLLFATVEAGDAAVKAGTVEATPNVSQHGKPAKKSGAWPLRRTTAHAACTACTGRSGGPL